MNRPSYLNYLLTAFVALTMGAMAFLAGFGAGFGTGRLTAPERAAAAAVSVLPSPEAGEPVEPTRAARPTPTPTVPAPEAQLDELPEEFDLVWEAWRALEEDFYGDLPETPEMVGGLVAGMLRAAQRETDEALEREETANAVMLAVLRVLEERYGELPDPKPLTYGAINGVTEALNDPYTELMDAETAAFFNESLEGSFEGIGARVDLAKDGGVLIVEPFEGQPAWNAGLRRNDVIIAVDGRDITNLSLREAISLIRGPKGTRVVLTVRSPGQEPRDVEVVRARIVIPVVTARMLDNNIAYLKLGEFSGPATDQLRKALDQLLANRPVGLILDLRGNPGGYLRTAVDIADEFLPEGTVLIERFKDGEEQVYASTDRGRAEEIPLVVLVNEASASASEIVAGAIQDRQRAILIGAQTFGKGSVQVPHNLSDGSLLRVTTARWFTPNDRQINGEGLLPDIVVPMSDEDIEAGRDPQLDRAVEYLLNLKSKP
ncbi:MAG: S41 family peptidase [Caldilineales bacterium]|nr:S41 family peptidase [Caldilineales bacterium]MDW8318208.1 S41 family peptidase [Anaerolineae bacterium]